MLALSKEKLKVSLRSVFSKCVWSYPVELHQWVDHIFNTPERGLKSTLLSWLVRLRNRRVHQAWRSVARRRRAI